VKHDAELRKNMLDRGMSAADVELAMRGFGTAVGVQSSSEDSLWFDGELAKCLAVPHRKSGMLYSPETIDYVLRTFRGVSGNEKESIFNAVNEMIAGDAGDEQLIAAVRGLCRVTDWPVGPRRHVDSNEMAANLPLELRH
jgi:hypothetical protein